MKLDLGDTGTITITKIKDNFFIGIYTEVEKNCFINKFEVKGKNINLHITNNNISITEKNNIFTKLGSL